MSLGIGLGGFMDGMQAGMRMRESIDNRKIQKAQLAEQEANKASLAAIDTETKAQFDGAVAEGTAQPDQFEEFWTKYALPRRRAEMLRQGNIEGAKALQEWGESDSVKQGGRLFSSAMLKAQTGDAGGALQDAIKAGQVKGYIEHGFELTGQEDIVDQSGAVIGYRLKVKDADGKIIEQDVAVGDVPKVIATFANPDAAWMSQEAARGEKAKREQEIADYEKKEQIKSRYAKGSTPDYEKAYSDAREARMKDDLDFADLTEEEQDRVVRADLDKAGAYAKERTGLGGPPMPGPQAAPGLGPSPVAPGGAPAPSQVAPAPTGEQITVDETTGERVPAPAAAPPGGQVAPAQPMAPAPGLGQAPAAKPVAAAPDRAAVIADAAAHMKAGGNPEYIAMRLINAGIQPAEWPVELQGVAAKAQGTAVGLGQ